MNKSTMINQAIFQTILNANKKQTTNYVRMYIHKKKTIKHVFN